MYIKKGLDKDHLKVVEGLSKNTANGWFQTVLNLNQFRQIFLASYRRFNVSALKECRKVKLEHVNFAYEDLNINSRTFCFESTYMSEVVNIMQQSMWSHVQLLKCESQFLWIFQNQPSILISVVVSYFWLLKHQEFIKCFPYIPIVWWIWSHQSNIFKIVIVSINLKPTELRDGLPFVQHKSNSIFYDIC